MGKGFRVEDVVQRVIIRCCERNAVLMPTGIVVESGSGGIALIFHFRFHNLWQRPEFYSVNVFAVEIFYRFFMD